MKLKNIDIAVQSLYSTLEDAHRLVTELIADLPEGLDKTELTTVMSNVEDSMLTIDSFLLNELEDARDLFNYED